MRDLVFVGYLVALLFLAFKRPFLFTLIYAYIDIVAPQRLSYFMLNSVPLSLIVFALALFGYMFADNKQDSRFSFRQTMMILLLAYCGYTTVQAEVPDAALEKWDWVWKALVFAAFLPLTLRTRLRLESAVLFIVLAVGTIAINGGLKTVLGGGGYGTLSLLVREDAGLYEGSIISAVAVCIIPLAIWLARHGTIFKPDWKVWLFAAGLIFACLLIPVGTTARTGLVCIAALGALLLRSVRYRFVYAGLAGIALMTAIPFLPQSYMERMGTITGYEGDESASTRLAVWAWTIDYAKANPMGGGFDAYRSNSFTYRTRTVSGEGASQQVEYSEVTEEGRAYHSSYFELLGEQGFIGFGLWIWLNLLGLWHMEKLRWRFAKREGGRDSWQWGLATALQQSHAVYLVGAMFVGIGYQPFLFMLVGLQCGLWSYVKRTEAPPQRARFKRAEGPAEEAEQPAAA